jgi:transcriptional regulator of acetoin/glycerol metabolism
VVLDDSARGALVAHGWPGNVRELKNAIQRAALLCQDGLVTARDLGLATARTGQGRLSPDAEPDRAAIEAALRNARGVISQAAAELGLSRQALYRRMDKLGIESANPARDPVATSAR